MDIEREIENLMEFIHWAFEPIQPKWMPHSEEMQKRLLILKKAIRHSLEEGLDHRKKPNHIKGTHDILLSWKKEYATGNPIMDEQHQALMRSGNEIFEAMLSEAPKSKIESLVGALIVEIGTHFDMEEELMRTQHLGVADHVQKHQRLRHKANKLFIDYQQNRKDLGVLLEFIVADLILNHVSHEDRLFRSNGASLIPN
jgi:hemerythrin-like metal-binding protein